MHLKIGAGHSLTATDCLNILRCTPSLKELKFRVDFGSNDDFENPKGRVHLTNLSDLHISWSWRGDSDNALRLLDGIDPPSLKTLSVDYPDDHCEEDSDYGAAKIIFKFVYRCNISLTDLRMSSVYEDLQIVNILRLSPNLQTLDLHCHDIPQEVYAELSKTLVHKKSGRVKFPLCPRLASISLFSERIDMDIEMGCCDDAELLHESRPAMKLISRRWNVPASQRSLSVVKVGWLSLDEAPELMAMVSDGLGYKQIW